MIRRLNFPVELCLLLLLAGHCGAQTYATVTGNVRDASGAVIPNAALVLTNVDQNRPWKSETNQVGAYSFQQIPPGNYRLEVEAQGFKKFSRSGLILNVAQVAEIDVPMALGAVSETVEITAETPLLETASSTLGEVVNQVTATNLPLNGRNLLQLVALTPGINTTSSYRSSSSASGSTTATGFSANGGRNMSNQILLDGTPQEVMGFNQAAFVPSPDALQEFKVQTNAMSAEYGRTGGAIINMVHRSGTKDFHAGLYEFLRNDKFDANGFFRNRNRTKKSGFRYNQFGVTAGGPLTKGREKLFFFFNYEGQKVTNAGGGTFSAPTVKMRSGDFSELLDPRVNSVLQTIYDPLSPDQEGRRTAFPGNIIPKGRLNPVGVNLASYFPLPTDPSKTFNNFFSTQGSRVSRNTVSTKLDYRLSPNHSLFGRFSWDNQDNQHADEYGTAASQNLGWDGVRNRSLTIDDTAIVHGWIIHHNAGLAYSANPRDTPDLPGVTGKLGLPAYINPVRQREIFPTVEPAGYSRLGVDVAFIIGNKFYNVIYSGDASKLLGSHTLKFGGQYRLNRASNFRPNNPGGYYTFNSTWTREYFNKGLGGDAIASMLLGDPSGGSMRTEPALSIQVPYGGLFLQDDWRVSSRLTLNAGVRWDRDAPLTEKWDRASWWDPNAKLPLAVPGLGPFTGGVVFAGAYNKTGDNRRGTSDMPWTNFAPRFGLAYKASEKLVIRSGFGIFYAPTTGIGPNATNVGALGFNSNTAIATSIDGGRTPYATLSNPFPDGFNLPENGSRGLLTLAGDTVATRFRNRENPYSAQWNLDAQYEFPKNLLLDVAYAGNAGVHMLAGANELDQLPDQYLALGDGLNKVVNNPFFGAVPASSGMGKTTTTAGQLLRPYPYLTGLSDQWSTLAHSTYHALQVKFRKRYSNGIQFLAAYTWSKMIDDISSTGSFLGQVNPGYTNFYNRRLDKSISALDVAQVLVFNYQWDLPVGKGKHLLNRGGIADYVLGGWVVNGISTYQSGLPISIGSRSNTLGNFNGTQRPNMTGVNPNTSGSDTARIDQWINPAAFSDAPLYTYGNTGKFVPGLRGPMYHNWDVSILKNFSVRERIKLQFRTEMFNALNQVNFLIPGATSFGTSNFGAITGAEGGRVIQFGLKLNY